MSAEHAGFDSRASTGHHDLDYSSKGIVIVGMQAECFSHSSWLLSLCMSSSPHLLQALGPQKAHYKAGNGCCHNDSQHAGASNLADPCKGLCCISRSAVCLALHYHLQQHCSQSSLMASLQCAKPVLESACCEMHMAYIGTDFSSKQLKCMQRADKSDVACTGSMPWQWRRERQRLPP